MTTPTFHCVVCNKRHNATQINGEWYLVNGMCFAGAAVPPTSTEPEFDAEVQRLARLFAALDTDEDEIWWALEDHEWVIAWEHDQVAAHAMQENLFQAVKTTIGGVNSGNPFTLKLVKNES